MDGFANAWADGLTYGLAKGLTEGQTETGGSVLKEVHANAKGCITLK